MSQAPTFDVIVVGAGLSGIAAGHYLQAICPGRSYAILEGREAIGGTWDLFRYPGVRSDSDMFTLGYTFRPWESDAAFADGPAIREYVRATAREEGIDKHIRYGHRVIEAQWDSAEAAWTVTARTRDGDARFRCAFLFFCSGYYDYERGHEPDFPGRDRFTGTVVHPQHWPQGLGWRGKRVVVIGSGATAITLVPELAREAAHVTMLQRSPSYIVALPAIDRIGKALRRVLPRGLAYRLVRWKNILASTAFYQFCQHWPGAARSMIAKGAQQMLGPGFDVARHLSPRYDPWDQRLCIAPDGDVFSAIRQGKASIVTDTIETFTPSGIRLASGAEVPADIVVTATGLKLKMMGGARLRVDGREVNPGDTVVYRAMMFSGLPNFAVAMGYTNASWTLRCELVARQVARLLAYMDRHGWDWCVPVREAGAELAPEPLLDLSSGYVQRAAADLPKQGTAEPWRMSHNYLRDALAMRWGPLAGRGLRFGRRAAVAKETRAAP